MIINLDEINRSEFVVSEREHSVLGKVVLVAPKKGKVVWSLDELHLRSLLCDLDGNIICSGFPKFMNYGENDELDRKTRRSISEGRVFFSEKMDGSLIIRTVINGVPCFRTRGSHNLGDFEGPVMSLVREKYPKLLDPNYYDDEKSMLFEYTSPDNKIIVDYDESELTFLGMMRFKYKDSYPAFDSDPVRVRFVCQETGVRAPKFYDLGTSIKEVVSSVSGWQNAEGIVVWCELGMSQHLAKIKASEYLRLHSLKYHLTEAKIRMVCYAADITDENELRETLEALDVDWEFMKTIAVPALNTYMDDKHRSVKFEAECQKMMDEHKILNLPTKKRIALALKNLCGKDKKAFNYCISFASGDISKAARIVSAMHLGIPVNALKHYTEVSRKFFGGLRERGLPQRTFDDID